MSRENIMYLYVKKCTHCGVGYFGFTRKKNPFKYKGSGTRWTRHMNKHGWHNHKTIEIYGFDDDSDCIEFAIQFSIKNYIVDSLEWFNIKDESGPLEVGFSYNKGKTYEEIYGDKKANELKNNRSSVHKGKTVTNSTREKLRFINLGKSHNITSRDKMSKQRIGKKWFNDGNKSYHLSSDDIHLVYELKLVEGRLMNKTNLKFTTSTKNCIRITDGIRNNTIPADSLIPDGWHRGQTKKK